MPEGVPSEYPVVVEWQGEQRFSGGGLGGEPIVLDGKRASGPSPVDVLLVAVASCAGIDVVDILGKRRTPVSKLRVTAEFSRAASPPRRLTQVALHFDVEVDSEAHHVERAIELSIKKYCSVSATFAPDTELTWTARVRPAS